MKKGLLLSVVASGFIFAGGNIAPVQPVAQPQVAPAACDFWGTLAARYDDNKLGESANKWGKEDNVATGAIVLGVEKNLGNGFGFGAELAGLVTTDGEFKNANERAELSQAYLTYKNGNTAVKIGRQALPKSLSPWAWSDRTAGVIDRAFNGIVVVNTDLADTTLVGAWVHSFTDTTGATRIDQTNGKKLNRGLLMLTAQYKGIANTTLTGSIYYVPKFLTSGKSAISTWASAETKAGNVDLGLQVAYAKNKGTKATTGVAAYVGTNFNGLDAKLTLAYLKSGATPLALGGTNAFWGNSFAGTINGDIADLGSKQKIARLDLGYKIAGYGKVYGGVAYDKYSSSATDKKLAARLGYKFKIGSVDANVEYRYLKTTPTNGAAVKDQKVRVEGIYKF